MDKPISSATVQPTSAVAFAAPAAVSSAADGSFLSSHTRRLACPESYRRAALSAQPTASTAAPLAACTLSVQVAQDFIRLIPAGRFEAPRGALSGEGPWFLSAEGAAQIVAAHASRSSDILIDYEHQSLLAAENGQPAPAAGWIDPRSLAFRADGPEPGLYGRVRWTASAAARIAADEYRYLSPTFFYDAASGEVTGLQSVALTNDPAIDEPVRAALRAASPSPQPLPHEGGGAFIPKGDSPMNLKNAVIAALGLAATASDDEALAALAALKKTQGDLDAELAALKTTAEARETELAALKAKTDPAKSVPVEAAQAMQAEIAALSAKIEASEREALIAANTAKIPGALAEWARTQPLAALKTFLEKAPDIAALSGMQSGGKGGPAASGPSADEQAICKSLGLSAEQFNKVKKEA